MYIYGKNVAKEALSNNQKINEILISNGFNDKDILDLIEQNNLKVTLKDKKHLDRLVSGLHQNIILKVEDFKYSELKDVLNNENQLFVILDHIEDPHNFGAIIRTCEAAKVDAIIIPKNRSVEVNATVIKTSAGATSNIKICMVTNLSSTIKDLKKKGFWFIGTDMDGENYKELNYDGKVGLIIGSEGFGMARLIKEECDFIASIPMKGKVNSLNASVAAGIIIFEAVSRR